MMLYKVPKGSKIKLADTEEEYLFHHLDGAFSYCTNDKGDVVHLVAWEEVDIVKEKKNDD